MLLRIRSFIVERDASLLEILTECTIQKKYNPIHLIDMLNDTHNNDMTIFVKLLDEW